MALKIDLEKAYDCVKWDFLEDALVDVGLPSLLVRVITYRVSSSSLQVLLNGSFTEEFRPSRGIRQGDLLSSYLFVICVERLSHLIEVSLEQVSWKPLHLSRGGPTLTPLVFMDDLFLFREADNG